MWHKLNSPRPLRSRFAYHESPGALQRLVPPWESVELEHSDNSLEVGSRVVMKTKIAGVPLRWVAKHTEYKPPTLFADTQVSGPFASWDHRHEFSSLDADTNRSRLRDHIEYRLPMGALGRIFGSAKARKTIEAMFAFRHQITRDDLQLSADHPTGPMTVAISGSSGMVGSSMSSLLTLLGHQVRPIVRSPDQDASSIAAWSSPEEAAELSSVDAVIHLAGKSIASSRWTDEVKAEIRDSRVIKTRQLCESLAKA